MRSNKNNDPVYLANRMIKEEKMIYWKDLRIIGIKHNAWV